GAARPDLGPFVLEPTLLTDVTDDMQCFAGETFGPLVAVTVVENADAAVAAANASEFGLNASVMSASRRRAREVAARLRAGSVNRKSTRLNSSHVKISYAVFCLKKKRIAEATAG